MAITNALANYGTGPGEALNAAARQMLANRSYQNTLQQQQFQNTLAQNQDVRAQSEEQQKQAAREMAFIANIPDGVDPIQALQTGKQLGVLSDNAVQQLTAAGPDGFARAKAFAKANTPPELMAVPQGGTVIEKNTGKVIAQGAAPQSAYEWAIPPGSKVPQRMTNEDIIKTGATPYQPPSQAQPVAPTITQIISPDDPSQMLVIDARQYKGGGIGSPGVLGLGGKTPEAAKTQESKDVGINNVNAHLDALSSLYDHLNSIGGIGSTEKGAISNISASLASSEAGQVLGRAVQTTAQMDRDQINTIRPLLISGIRQALGISARGMDSNVELKFYMQAATDPTRGYEVNKFAIQHIRDWIASGGDLSKTKEQLPINDLQKVSTAPAAAAAPVTQQGWSARRIK